VINSLKFLALFKRSITIPVVLSPSWGVWYVLSVGLSAKLKELDGEAHTKAHCRLYSHIVYKKYPKIDAKGNLEINMKAVKEA